MEDIDPIAAQIAQEQQDADAAAAGSSPLPTASLPAAPPQLEHPIDTSTDVGVSPTYGQAVRGGGAVQLPVPGFQPGGEVAVGPGTQAGGGGQSPAPTSAPDPDADPIALQIKQEQEEQDRRQAQLLDWRAQNDGEEPGRRAEVLRYSAASGFSPDFVSKSLDGVKKMVDAKGVDWNKVIYQQPALAQMMLDKPELTPLVKDDAADLGIVEWAIGSPFLAYRDQVENATPLSTAVSVLNPAAPFLQALSGGAPGHAFTDALNEQRTIGRQFIEAQGLGSEENRAKIRELEGTYGNKDYGAHSWVTKGIVGGAKMLPFLAGDTAARTIGGAIGTALVGLEGVAGGAATGAPAGGVGAVPGAAVGGVAGAVTGGSMGQFIGSGLFNYYESLGPLYWQLSNLKDADGNPMDPTIARSFAQGGAALTGMVMAGFMGKYAAKLPGVSSLMEKLGANTVEKAMLDLSAGQAAKRGLKSFGEHWLTGAAMMAGQSALNAAAGEGAKAVAGPGFDAQWSNVGTAAGSGFVNGLQDMWLISAIGPGREMLTDIGRARASAESAARLESMTSSAAASKLLERFPQGFQELVGKMKEKDGAVENVHIPSDEWATYWQGKKLDPAEVAGAVMGDDGKAFSEALQTKGDLVIPVEKYLTKLAKTEHAEGLAENIKLRPDELTPKQFGAEQQRLTERMKEQAKVRGSELEAGKKEVHDFILDQATEAGIGKEEARANAKLVSEYAGTLALRLGVSVPEAAARGSLGQLRVLGPKGEAVAEAARERFSKFVAPDAEEFLRKRLTTMSPESRSREVFIDKNTGVTNEKAFNEAKSDKPFVAQLSVEGVKHLNDTLSHDRADLLYRAVAKAAHEVDPTAAKVGGDLAVHVKDQAELDDVLKRVNDTVAVKGFQVTGALGANLGEAGDAHTALKQAAETAGTRAGRGKKPLGLQGEGKDIVFPTERAKGEVPAELHQRIAGLSDEKYFNEAYRDKGTGVWSNEAWDAMPRKRAVAAFDLKGLKRVNSAFGEEYGDKMIARFGKVAKVVGGAGFDFAHLHGDEYAAQHADPAHLQSFIKALDSMLKLSPVEYVEPETGEKTHIDVQFRYGLGEWSYESADRDLNERKAKEAQPGTGGAVGEQAWDAFDPRAMDVRDDGRPGPVDNGRTGGGGDEGSGGEGGTGSSPVSPEEEDLALEKGAKDALALISKMRSPEKQAEFTAWFRYTQGIDSEMPKGVSDETVKKLASFGLVDPVNGFTFGEDGRDMARSLPGKKSFGVEPAELRRIRLSNMEHRLHGYDATRYEQGPVVAHVEGEPVTYRQGDDESPRGTIQMQLDPNGKPRSFAIQVLAGDKSTFLHETSHFLSWSLHDVATSDLATPDIAEDYSGLLKWAGYASPEERLAQTQERDVLQKKTERTPEEDARLKELSAKEERISHGFEQYMLEGKAPSAALAKVFSRFRGWLVNIYRGLSGIQEQYRAQYGQEIGLSDDVRGIFDRLLAQDDAIKQARSDTGLPTEPAPDVSAAMTPEERDQYRKLLEGSRLGAEQELARRSAEIQQDQVGEARARITDEVTAKLDEQPVYTAWRFLQKGSLPEAIGKNLTPEDMDLFWGEKGKAFKLDRGQFLKEFGPEEAKKLPPGSLVRKGGVGADELAPLFGFQDGQEMVEAFAKAEPRDQAIARQTQDRIDAEYGPALKEIASAALAAVHNDDAARATLLELRSLAKRLDPSTAARVNSIDLPTLKAHAERLVGETAVGDLEPERYSRTERQAALKAAELWGAGEKEQSLDQREARLLNQLLYRAARDAQERLDKVHDKLEKTSEAIRANLGKADPAYRDVHDQVLGAVGLGEPPAEGGKSLDEMMAQADADAQPVAFDVQAIRDLLAKPKDWDTLTVDEAGAVSDAVTNIRHIARQTLEVQLAGKRQEKASFLQELADRMKDVRPPQPAEPYSKTAEGLRDKLRHARRGASTLLQDVETWSEMMDGGTSGPAHQLLIESRLEARNKEAELQSKVLAPIKKLWENVPKEIRKLRGRKVDVADLLPIPPGGEGLFDPVYTRDQLWSLFMNWGNEGNRQRIRDGNGWSDANVEKALGMLSKPELTFLQGVMDTIESLYPALAKSHEQRTGLQLDKVDATPITLNGETYRGGYFPLKYDSRFSKPGEMQEGEAIKSLFAPNYVRPSVARGHTKERADRVDAPVDMTWGTVPAHLAQVVHDIAYGDWVRQAGSILLDKGFKSSTTQFLGGERSKELVPWLRDVANSRVDSSAGHVSDFLKTAGNFARSRLALAAIGLNIPALGRHLFDPWTTMADSEAVLPQHITSAYLKVMNPANWNSIPEFAQSKELAYRDAMHKENLRAELGRIAPKQGLLARVTSEVAFKANEWMDHFTTRVTFLAAYNQAIANELSPADAAKRADDVVRRALPSGDIAEKPPLLRTKHGLASAVMFYGYASKIHNLRARSFDAAYRAWNDADAQPSDKVSAIATVAAKWLAVGAVSSMGAYFAGRAWKKDEDPVEWAGKEVLLSPLDDVAIVGPAAKKALTGHKVNIASAPELALTEQTFQRIGDLINKPSSASKRTSDRVFGAVEALLSTLGPVGQVHRSVGYLKQVENRSSRPRGPLDVAGGLFYGDRPDAPTANPLTDAQTLFGGRR